MLRVSMYTEVADMRHCGESKMQINKLRGKIAENRTSISKLAKKMGINPSTLYRKFNSGDITVRQADTIIKLLHLTFDEVQQIFFG